MKINHKILSIPPFLSTSWKNVTALRLNQEGSLIIYLVGEKEVEVPGLKPAMIEAIFAAHERFLESEKPAHPAKDEKQQMISFGLPMKMGLPGMDTIGPLLQHNPEQADMPNFPPDLLQQITSLSKALSLDNAQLPQAEPHCNCPHCQIVRSLANQEQEEHLQKEETLVSEEDLQFCNWKIEKTGENLYTLTNLLDVNETYNVFLGSPVGCTCGEKHCEHIQAVLKS